MLLLLLLLLLLLFLLLLLLFDINEESLSQKKNWNGVRLEEEGKTSKFVDAGSKNWIEREGNWQHEMGWQERMVKKIKTLGTEIVKTLIFCKKINHYLIVSYETEIRLFATT